MTDTTRLKSTIFVAGLDSAVTAHTLHAAFVPFGEILDVTLPKPELPSSTEPHRGFGYVEFEQIADAREAIDNMDQSELYGRVIKVAAAKPQKDQSQGLGAKTAVWEQVRLYLGITTERVIDFVCRRVILRNMLLVRRIDWLWINRMLRTRKGRWILCKVWKGWM